jgi:DNA-binding GntR family transcriptional regulator
MDAKFEWLEQRTTTPDGVYRVLRAAILDGAVPPGGQLREARIAADLGISRSPLREALTKLEEEGLIVKIPFRGAFVVEVSAEDVAEIASLRLLVEPYAAELSAEALRGPQKLTLMQTVDDLKRATQDHDIPASIDAHLRFHRLFYDLSGHRLLQSLWNGWEPRLRLYLAADHRSYRDLHDLAVEHESLAATVTEGDVGAFQQELARHFPSALGARGPDPDMTTSPTADGTFTVDNPDVPHISSTVDTDLAPQNATHSAGSPALHDRTPRDPFRRRAGLEKETD